MKKHGIYIIYPMQNLLPSSIPPHLPPILPPHPHHISPPHPPSPLTHPTHPTSPPFFIFLGQKITSPSRKPLPHPPLPRGRKKKGGGISNTILSYLLFSKDQRLSHVWYRMEWDGMEWKASAKKVGGGEFFNKARREKIPPPTNSRS